MKTITVSQLNGYLKNLISYDHLLSRLSVKGEVSNCKYHSMGHIYFSLKDESASIPCVMFRQQARTLPFRLENGQMVTASGQMDVYERDGRCQLVVRTMTQADEKGELMRLYEELKARLSEEGLFDFEIKKEIPRYPKRVGIVTAPTGAAIRDIEQVARRRNPYVELILYPAKVQGDGAAAQIARGIGVLDRMGLDTIIIGRGGGSMEDLWAFNEEVVAKAIYEAGTPIISGTGHEIDTTIADYAADKRAPTPSAAAELAIPDIMTTVRSLREKKSRLHLLMEAVIREKKKETEGMRLRLERLSPERLLRGKQQRLAELSEQLRTGMRKCLSDRELRLRVLVEKLNGRSPSAKLVHGYGYLSRAGKPLENAADIAAGDDLTVTLHDGVILAEAKEVRLNGADE